MNILILVTLLNIPIHTLYSFQTYDQDGDGVVTFKELSRGLLQRKSMQTNSQPNQRKEIQDKYTAVEMTAIGMGIHEKPFDRDRFRQLMEKGESTPMDVLENYPDVLVDVDRFEDEIRNSVLNAPIFKDLNEPSQEEEEPVTRTTISCDIEYNLMTTKEKQEYLYAQIIEANYDPEEFQEYMQKQKGVHLQDYTLAELTNLVTAFKRKSKTFQDIDHKIEIPNKSQGNSGTASGSASGTVSEGALEGASQGNSLQISQFSSKDDESINSTNKTNFTYFAKSQLPALFNKIHVSNEYVEVKVRSYSKIQSTSFFKTTYIVYSVEANKYQVKRRFSQFQWLHKHLTLMYPGLPIPPIPEKTAMRSFDEKHLEARMIMFEKFLKKILKIPQLCSDHIVEDFLTLQQFGGSMNQYEARLSHRGSSIWSIKGAKGVNKEAPGLTPELITRYARKYQLIATLNEGIGRLQEHLHAATEQAYSITHLFRELSQYEREERVRNVEMYDLLGDFISELGSKLEREHHHLKDYLQSEWNYQEKYTLTLLTNLEETIKEPHKIHYKYRDVIEKMKEDTNETQNIYLNDYLKAKEYYRIKLSFLLEELNRQQESELRGMAKEWLFGFHKYIDGVKDAMLSGADMLTSAMSVSEGKSLLEVEYISKRKKDSNKLISSMINQI